MRSREIALAGFGLLFFAAATPSYAQAGRQCMPAVANPDMYRNCRIAIVQGNEICRCGINPAATRRGLETDRGQRPSSFPGQGIGGSFSPAFGGTAPGRGDGGMGGGSGSAGVSGGGFGGGGFAGGGNAGVGGSTGSTGNTSSSNSSSSSNNASSGSTSNSGSNTSNNSGATGPSADAGGPPSHSNAGGNGNGHGKDKDKDAKGNNGFGNGGDDGGSKGPAEVR